MKARPSRAIISALRSIAIRLQFHTKTNTGTSMRRSRLRKRCLSRRTWQSATTECVTTRTRPGLPLVVEREREPDALTQKEVTRVTAEIYNSHFDKEHTDEIQLSVAGAQAVINKKLFCDRDMSQDAYRLIFNHKTQG